MSKDCREFIDELMQQERHKGYALGLDQELLQKAFAQLHEQAGQLILPQTVAVRAGALLQTDLATTQEFTQELQQQQLLVKEPLPTAGLRSSPWLIQPGFYQAGWLQAPSYGPQIRLQDRLLQGPTLHQLRELIGREKQLASYQPLFDKRIYMSADLLPEASFDKSGPSQGARLLDRCHCRCVLVFIAEPLQIRYMVALATAQIEVWAQKIRQVAPQGSLQAVLVDLHAHTLIASYGASYDSSQLKASLDFSVLLAQLAIALGYCNSDDMSLVASGLEVWAHQQGYAPVAQLVSAVLSSGSDQHLHAVKLDQLLEGLKADFEARLDRLPRQQGQPASSRL